MAVWRVTGLLGRPLAQLTSRKQMLAHNEAARCSNLSAEPARATGVLAGIGPSIDQQFLWEKFASDSALLQDRSQTQEARSSKSKQVLWFDDRCKPAGVDSELPAAAPALASSWSVPDDVVSNVTAATVRELCQQGEVSEAVEALGVMVHAGRRFSKALFATVLKECMARKDLPLCRRVHALSLKKGVESDMFLCNHILRMYSSHGRLQEAVDVFTEIAEPDAFAWSTIISAHVKRGQEKQAIQLYHRMRRSDVKPDGHVFAAALQACAKALDLKSGQLVHADVLAAGVVPDVYVRSSLVDMYAKCGSLEAAKREFNEINNKNVVSWNALIAGHVQQGLGKEAFDLYKVMQKEGIVGPDFVTFMCLLQACARLGPPALEKGRELHVEIRKRRLQGDKFVTGSLVNMYAKCGSLEDARSVFDGLAHKDVVTWSALITGYSQQGKGLEAFRLLKAMQEEGLIASSAVTFVSLLQACASAGSLALENGKRLHAQIRERGLQGLLIVGGSLVNMYAKCGSLEDARAVFDGLVLKDVVTWSAMIAGYSQKGLGQEALKLYRAMEEGMTSPDAATFVSLLQACASMGTQGLEKGKYLHVRIREHGLQGDVIVSGSLITMYAKCGSLEDARGVFDGFHQKNVVMWNAMIAGYSQQNMGHEALGLYDAMQEEGMAAPNSITFSSLLQACASVGSLALEKGQQLHAQIREQGLQADVFVGTSLVYMYAKCGNLTDARAVFDGLGQRTVVTWSSMIAGYAQQGMGQEALGLYAAMEDEGIAANSVTFVGLLQACASVGSSALEKGKQIHTQIRERGFQSDLVIGGSLVNMYAKCGSVEDARGVFDTLTKKNVVTWTAMIAGYSQTGMGREAISLYRAMQEEGVATPDCVTFVCLLQACATVAALDLGMQLHAQIKEHGLQSDVLIAGSLIHMYGKCGSMAAAQQEFEEIPEKGVVIWNALIAGYARQGDSQAVFDLISRMSKDGIQPDSVTFLSVLTACSHTGEVNKGRDFFDTMSRRYGIMPTADHYTCMVDLMSRAGKLDEALAWIGAMPVLPNAAVWHTLLNACRKWSNVEVGRHAFQEAMKLDSKDASAYVLMSNIYTNADKWGQAHDLQARRRGIGAWKQPGQSWWTDVEGLVHSFCVGDTESSAGRFAGRIHDWALITTHI